MNEPISEDPKTPPPSLGEGDDASRVESEASAQATDRPDGQHHVEAPAFSWEPIATADKEDMVLVWDGAFLGYPIAAEWRKPRQQKFNRKGRPHKPVTVALGPGEWVPVEEDLRCASDSVGGLNPTHWLKWKPPSRPTYSAWDK